MRPIALTTNIADAMMGLAVPTYVWDAGVKTEADLAEHADKFGMLDAQLGERRIPALILHSEAGNRLYLFKSRYMQRFPRDEEGAYFGGSDAKFRMSKEVGKAIREFDYLDEGLVGE